MRHFTDASPVLPAISLAPCSDKEHSTIIYECPQPGTPLLRLSWNKQDPRYIAGVCPSTALNRAAPALRRAAQGGARARCCCAAQAQQSSRLTLGARRSPVPPPYPSSAALAQDSPRVTVLDIRYPTMPVAELQRHQASANAVCWAPHSSVHLCSAGDDCQVPWLAAPCPCLARRLDSSIPHTSQQQRISHLAVITCIPAVRHRRPP